MGEWGVGAQEQICALRSARPVPCFFAVVGARFSGRASAATGRSTRGLCWPCIAPPGQNRPAHWPAMPGPASRPVLERLVWVSVPARRPPTPPVAQPRARVSHSRGRAPSTPSTLPSPPLSPPSHTTTKHHSRRHVLDKGESLVDHATAAASAALAAAGVDPADVGVVLLATSSPDDLFGSGPALAAAVGATKAVAFDLTAACSGFVLGLITGAQFVRAGGARHVLVVGADALSRYVDWRDRGTCILFGDGAGAVVLSAGGGDGGSSVDDGPSTSAPSTSSSSCGLLGFAMASDGVGAKHLNAKFAGCGGKALAPDADAAGAPGSYANIAMNGQEVFKFAVRAVPAVVEAALADAGLPGPQAIDWLVLHQANQRILDAAASRLGVPPDRVVSNLAEYGNTSAASIPLALDEAVRDGRIKSGDVVAVAGFGAGLTWASAIFRYG
jgi:3-oxoacyl-[acyl-carrier-protein] synthase III